LSGVPLFTLHVNSGEILHCLMGWQPWPSPKMVKLGPTKF
jgi:hypothetical protein